MNMKQTVRGTILATRVVHLFEAVVVYTVVVATAAVALWMFLTR